MIAYILLILTAIDAIFDFNILFKKQNEPQLKKAKFQKEKKSTSKWVAWIRFSILILSTTFAFVKQYKDDKINATTGEIDPLSYSNSLKQSDYQVKYVPVKLGSNILNISEQELNSGASIPLVVFNDSDPGSDNITVRKTNNKLFINAKVRSFEGKIVAEIINNEWQTPEASQHADRNYDDSAFEIKDSYGMIVLQVSMENDTIKVLGVNDRINGKDIILNDSTVIYTVKEGVDRYIQLSKYIKPLFKYPSKEYIGVRDK